MPKKLWNVLTVLGVKNAKPGRHADGGGLYLLVKPTGAKSWIYRATIAGKIRDIGLGSAWGADAVSLAEARDRAREKAREAAAGGVPMSDLRRRTKEAREARAAAEAAKIAGTSFKEAAERFLELNETSWRNDKHRAQWRNTLATYAYPHFGSIPVAAIDTSHVTAAIEPIWNEKPETASRVRGRIEAVLDAARVRGLRTGENPARWRGHLDKLLPKPSKLSRGHHAALPYPELPAFMTKLRARDAIAARALDFLILTAARTGEVREATWNEIDLNDGTWTIPASRMKGGKEHRVPLTPTALEILKGVKPLNTLNKPGAFVFPGSKGKSMSGMAMAMLLRRMDVDVTVHGFRSAFRDWAAECTAFPFEVAEMALAHVIGNKTEAAYRRGDLFERRRKLMEAWTDFCARHGAAGDNVTPLRAESG